MWFVFILSRYNQRPIIGEWRYQSRLVIAHDQTVVISQMWQLPLHFQAAPGIFTII